MILEVRHRGDGALAQTYTAGTPEYEAEIGRLARVLGRNPDELRVSITSGLPEETSAYLYRVIE